MRHVAYALVGIVSLLAAFLALAGNAEASGVLASAGALVLAALAVTGPAAPRGHRPHGTTRRDDAGVRDEADMEDGARHLPAP